MCHRFQLSLWHLAALICVALVPVFYYSSVLPSSGGDLVSECVNDPESKIDMSATEFLREAMRRHHERHHQRRHKEKHKRDEE